MNTGTGKVYQGKDIEHALARGEQLVTISSGESQPEAQPEVLMHECLLCGMDCSCDFPGPACLCTHTSVGTPDDDDFFDYDIGGSE